MTDEVSGEVSGRKSSGEPCGLLTGEVEEDDALKRVDGASCLSITSPGLRGYILHFVNPYIMFKGVNACGHAVPTRLVIWSVVITRYEMFSSSLLACFVVKRFDILISSG